LHLIPIKDTAGAHVFRFTPKTHLQQRNDGPQEQEGW
jgi:hypothetical protein